MKVCYVLAHPDGEIWKRASCEADELPDIEGAVECAPIGVTSRTHYVAGDSVIAYSSEQAAAKATSTSPWMKWSNATMAWVDPRQFSDIKAAQWETIKAVRESAEFGGFTWDESTFDSDPMSQSRIQGGAILAMQALAAEAPFELDWTLSDNTVRTLDAADMIGVGQAMAMHVATQHAIARTLRAAIQSATTQAEVEAITWP